MLNLKYVPMKKTILKAGGIAGLCAVLFLACKHELPFPPGVVPVLEVPNPGSSGKTCSPDTVYFANEIQPLLNSSCAMSGCHDAVTHAEGLNLSNYIGTLKIVSPGNPSSSKLYTQLLKSGDERMPPPPMTALSSTQIEKIQKWISQGAVNNVCDQCDTTNFKFATAIKPIMDNKCVGCHNAASLGGNVDLSSYAGIKAAAVSGKLYGSVTWSNGISAMPKGGVKMPSCEIVQIKKWIDAGTPNN